MSNKFPFLVFVLGFVTIFSSAVYGDNSFPQLKVLPWNGHKAASSLTFDDNDPIHLDFVIPELNRRKLHATFFIIANKVDRKDEWRQAIKAGHELGNHTLDHLHATALTPQQENSQVVGAQNVLQKEFGVPFYSFAYPFNEAPPTFKSWVEKTSFIARGGSPEMTSPDQKNFDWFNIPAKVTMTDYPFETYKGWIDEDLMYGDWLIWMIHGVEGTQWGWQPVPKKIFLQVLDYLQSKDVWVGTFIEIGGYLRAQKAFEAGTSKLTGTEALYTWAIPEHCPPNVKLKVTMRSGNSSFDLWQRGQKVLPDAQGNFSILFNMGELTLRPKQG